MTTETKPRIRTAVAVLLAAALVPLTASLVAPAGATATASTLKARPAALLAGERLVLSGRISPRLRRTVLLQRRSGSSWRTVAKKSSAATGAFSFTTTGRDRTTTYRVKAPAATIAGRRRAAGALTR